MQNSPGDRPSGPNLPVIAGEFHKETKIAERLIFPERYMGISLEFLAYSRNAKDARDMPIDLSTVGFRSGRYSRRHRDCSGTPDTAEQIASHP